MFASLLGPHRGRLMICNQAVMNRHFSEAIIPAIVNQPSTSFRVKAEKVLGKFDFIYCCLLSKYKAICCNETSKLYKHSLLILMKWNFLPKCFSFDNITVTS